MNRKVITARFHVAPGLGQLNGNSVNRDKDKAEILLLDSGVLVNLPKASTFVPFSNVVGVLLEQEAESEGLKDTRKSSK